MKVTTGTDLNRHRPGPRQGVRLAYLVTHPIQYQAPLLRRVAQTNNIDLHVFFQSDLSLREFADPGFGRSIQWDIPLLDGYSSEFLPSIGRRDVIDRVWPFSRGLARRLIVRKIDVLWVHGVTRPYNLLAIVTALRLGLRVLVRDEVNEISGRRRASLEIVKGVVFRTLCRAGTHFLAIGSRNRAYYIQHGVLSTQIHNVPYCVDNEYFQNKASLASGRREAFRKSLGLDANRLVILFASKFTKRKRPDLLIEAFEHVAAKVEDKSVPYLLMVGDGELRVPLERGTAAKCQEKIRFLGFKNQSELPALFDLCDVFVLPSINEPWGLIVNEVMNAGRAVIISDEVGCGPDLVSDGQNGFVVPADDRAALAQALLRAVSDPSRLKAMGEKSRRLIDCWSFNEDLDGLVSAIDSVIRLRA